MKKGILLFCEGSKAWIGGVYYIKNVAYQLAINPDIASKYRVHVLVVNPEIVDVFSGVSDLVKIHVLSVRERKNMNKFIQIYSFVNRIKCIFPKTAMESLQFDNVAAWVPDFQEYRLPEMFSDEERMIRRERYVNFSNESFPIILSSKDSRNDFIEYISATKKNVYVMPFVSYIEKEIKGLTDAFVKKTIGKYGIKDRFVLISNQFWKHKNHIVVLKAIELLRQRNLLDEIQFVFTGYPKDDRNPEYIAKILGLLEQDGISNSVNVIGFVDRMEQLALMKASLFVIQPSLFEGWGTVLEDAKVLDKRVALSDIPVHREQMNERCILFRPDSAENLVDVIIDMEKLQKDDDINRGIKEMHENALKYSETFLEMLNNLGN